MPSLERILISVFKRSRCAEESIRLKIHIDITTSQESLVEAHFWGLMTIQSPLAKKESCLDGVGLIEVLI
ncbi:hypothetical protein SHPE106448_18775 [Shewanella pealeana]